MSVLDNQSKLNASAALFAPASGGGGGGGGGPNLTVSSIVVNPAGLGIVFPNNTSTFQMTYATILDENNTSQNTVCFINNTPSVDLGLDVAVGGLYVCGDGGNFGSAPSGFLNVSNGDLTIAAPVAGDINLLSPTYISSLNVSSINGAAPGGGGGSVPANPYFSTISTQVLNLEDFNNPGQFPGRLRANSGSVLLEKQDATLWDLTLSSITVSSINGATPGGGGGSYPPDPAFSSISFRDGNTNFNFQGAPPSGTGIVFTNGGMSAPAPIAFNMGCNISSIVPSWPLSNSYSGDFIITQDPANLAGNLVMGSIAAVGNVIASITPTGVPIDLPIVANNVNMSSLVVSSINGAPVGGSVPANLGVSTLTVSDQPTAISSIFTLQATDGNLYEMSVLDSNATNLAGVAIGFVGGRNQVYIDSNAQIQNQLWVSSIQRCSEAFVSSFNVSSINGAAPGGGGGFTAQKIDWLNSGSNDLPLGATPGTFTPLTVTSGSLTNGHTYRATVGANLSNGDSTGLTAMVIEGSWGGLPATVFEAPNSAISSATGFFYTGGVGYFTTAGGSGAVRISGFNTGSSNTAVVGDNTFVILEDLGAI